MKPAFWFLLALFIASLLGHVGFPTAYLGVHLARSYR